MGEVLDVIPIKVERGEGASHDILDCLGVGSNSAIVWGGGDQLVPVFRSNYIT